jgi:hypothetical protein
VEDAKQIVRLVLQLQSTSRQPIYVFFGAFQRQCRDKCKGPKKKTKGIKVYKSLHAKKWRRKKKKAIWPKLGREKSKWS